MLETIHPAVGLILGAAAVVTAAATLHRFLVRPIVQVGLEVRELLRDLRGYPGRPGHPPRAGLVEEVHELKGQLASHLVWSEETTASIQEAIQEHLVESERTRQEGHREAAKLWDALAALSGHRDHSLRTRHDDDPKRYDPEETT